MSGNLLTQVLARPVLRRVLRPMVAFVGVTVAGIVGFVALAGVGVTEAAFWLLDPTSIELHFRAADGPETWTKLHAVLVASGMVLCTLWAGETVLTAALSGQIQEEIRQVRQERDIMRTDDHVVVCGYGMFGRTVARSLAEADRDVLVVEVDADHADQARQDGFLAVTGDARLEPVLGRAEIADAHALVAAVDDSNVNIQVAIVAEELAPQLETTVRVGEEMYESMARRAGADHVIIPEIMTGEVIADRIGGPPVAVEG